MGIYDILDNNLDVRNIIARATLAAKQCKGQYMIHEARYTEELRAKIIREQNIINEMEHALETGEFVVYFQPKYELDHCRPSGSGGAGALEEGGRYDRFTGGLYPCI